MSTQDDIRDIRKDVAAIQETIQTALQSILARLNALSPQDDMCDTAIVSALSPENKARQQEIIESGDADDAYQFARDIPGADIQELQQVVLDRGDGEDAWFFAKDVHGADIAALQQVVMDRGNEHDAYWFAKDVNGADIHALQQVILEHGDDWCAYYFAKDIPGADIEALQRVVLERSYDGEYVYHFAKNIPGADIQTLHDRLVELDSNYVDAFNTDQVIQVRLTSHLDAAGQLELKGTTVRKRHGPS